MFIDLVSAQTRADEYYACPEYQNHVLEMRALLERNRDSLSVLHIALDLEGVLVNTSFPKSLEFNESKRLRRPLAQELINSLSLFVKKLTLWTAATRRLTGLVLDASGLTLPPKTMLVYRENYNNNIERSSEPACQRIMAVRRNEMNLRAGISTEIINLIKGSKAKIPSVLGVDYLFDDQTQKHAAACEALGFPDEAGKLIRTSPFSLNNEDQIAHHHLDLGLLEMLRQFLYLQ